VSDEPGNTAFFDKLAMRQAERERRNKLPQDYATIDDYERDHLQRSEDALPDRATRGYQHLKR